MRIKNLYLAPAAVEDAAGPPALDRPGGFLESLAQFDPELAAKSGNPLADKAKATAKEKEKSDASQKSADERSGDGDAVDVGNADRPADGTADDKAKQTAAAEAAAKLAAEKDAKDKAAAEGDKGKPNDDDEKWPRNSADWEKFRKNRAEKEQTLRKEIETHSARVKELESKLGEAEVKLKSKPEADPEVQTENERLKAEVKELTDKIITLDVTAHPKFTAYFQQKETAALEKAKNIVGSELAPEIERILKLKDPEYRQTKLAEFLENTDTYKQARLAVVTDELDNINIERENEIKKAGEHRDTVAGQSAVQAKARAEAFEKGKQKLWADTLANVQDPTKGSPIWQHRDGQPEWNAAVDKRIASVQALLFARNLEPEKVFRAGFDAVAFPELLASYQDMAKSAKDTIDKLEAQVKALSSAQPRGGNGSGGNKGEEAELPAGTDPKTRLDKWAKDMSKEMAQFRGR